MVEMHKKYHFDGSDVNCLIFGSAVGPWATHYADSAHQPSADTPVPGTPAT